MRGRFIAALGVSEEAGIMVRSRVQVAVGRSFPALEVGVTTLGSGTRRGELGGLV